MQQIQKPKWNTLTTVLAGYLCTAQPPAGTPYRQGLVAQTALGWLDFSEGHVDGLTSVVGTLTHAA